MKLSNLYIYLSVVLLSALILILSAIALIANENNKNKSVVIAAPLKQIADQHGIDVGNFAINNHINDERYSSILTNHYNLALLDNTPNWYFTDGGLRPSRNEYNFSQMDGLVSFAKKHDMAIQAHHFVWGEEKWLPDWLKNGNYNKEEVLEIMKDHIYTVGKRYSGKVQEWTVVNEAHSRGQKFNNLKDWWKEALGDNKYIDNAFVWAREADPQAKLILNDFGNETYGSISDEMYEYIKNALLRGIPIDGVGFQMHIDGSNPPSKSEVIENMRRFGSLGINVYVTEFDVNMANVNGSENTRNSTQAKIYYDMARACIESMVCKSFSILGITDKETWYAYLGYQNSDPLIFDEEYNMKPSFCSLYEAFKEQPSEIKITTNHDKF
jgi:endo-1,4-beta-xylanase